MARTVAVWCLPSDKVNAAPGGFGTRSTVDATAGAPTSPVATGASATSVSVAFVAPADTGSGIRGYRATSSPGGKTKEGPASPLVVSGLTTGTPYTFTVVALTDAGPGPASVASNSVTPTA